MCDLIFYTSAIKRVFQCPRRYNRLFSTAHGEIKESESTVIFTLRFPKKYGKELITALHQEETEDMKAYIKTRKTNTEW